MIYPPPTTTIPQNVRIECSEKCECTKVPRSECPHCYAELLKVAIAFIRQTAAQDFEMTGSPEASFTPTKRAIKAQQFLKDHNLT